MYFLLALGIDIIIALDIQLKDGTAPMVRRDATTSLSHRVTGQTCAKNVARRTEVRIRNRAVGHHRYHVCDHTV
jgi:hypothetical protein